MIFGAKSEKLAVLDPTQIVLDIGGLSEVPTAANDDAAEDEDRQGRRRRPASRNLGALPKHLPRCEEVIEPESTICSCCGLPLHRIGEDVSEARDIIPALLRVIRTFGYACRACEANVVQAPARPRVMDGAMATTALVAQMWSSASSPGIFLSMASRRSSPVTASTSIGNARRLGRTGMTAVTVRCGGTRRIGMSNAAAPRPKPTFR